VAIKNFPLSKFNKRSMNEKKIVMDVVSPRTVSLAARATLDLLDPCCGCNFEHYRFKTERSKTPPDGIVPIHGKVNAFHSSTEAAF
jgi:hypothetical protein